MLPLECLGSLRELEPELLPELVLPLECLVLPLWERSGLLHLHLPPYLWLPVHFCPPTAQDDAAQPAQLELQPESFERDVPRNVRG